MRNIILLIAASMLIYTGCTEQKGLSYPTGYNTPGGAFTLLNKSINIGTLTSCTDVSNSLNCLAVYTSGSAGDGLTVSDGTTKYKIFRSSSSSLYTVQKITIATNTITCNQTDGGEFSITNNGDGTYTVQLIDNATNWDQCDLGAGHTVKAVVY